MLLCDNLAVAACVVAVAVVLVKFRVLLWSGLVDTSNQWDGHLSVQSRCLTIETSYVVFPWRHKTSRADFVTIYPCDFESLESKTTFLFADYALLTVVDIKQHGPLPTNVTSAFLLPPDQQPLLL